MVFANRNQAYGAYQLRAELGKRNQIALIVVLALIVIGLLVPLFLKFVIPQKKDDTITEVTNFSKLKEAEVKDQHIKKVQPKQPQQEVQRIKSSIKFTAPVIKEDDQVNEADEMKTQEALGKSQLTISIADVKGNDEEHGKDVAVSMGWSAPDEGREPAQDEAPSVEKQAERAEERPDEAAFGRFPVPREEEPGAEEDRDVAKNLDGAA